MEDVVQGILDKLAGYPSSIHVTRSKPHSSAHGSDISAGESMHPLLIKTLKHTHHELLFDKQRTVSELKQELFELCHVLPGHQRLIWKGRALNDEMALQDAVKDIQNEPKPLILHLVEKQIQ
jgi:hypothetical protein